MHSLYSFRAKQQQLMGQPLLELIGFFQIELDPQVLYLLCRACHLSLIMAYDIFDVFLLLASVHFQIIRISITPCSSFE